MSSVLYIVVKRSSIPHQCCTSSALSVVHLRMISPAVKAEAIQKGLRTLQLMPDWATMLFARQRFLPAASELGKARVGFSEEELREFTVPGCAKVRELMVQFVRNGGKIADISIGDGQFLDLVHVHLPSVLKSAIGQQTGHCQRTNLPVSKVQQFIIHQHLANDLGFFYNFYTEVLPDESVLIHQLFKVAEDASVAIDVEYLLSLSESEVAMIEALPKRIVVTISESADKEVGDPGFIRDIELFGNMGRDTDQVETSFKQLMVRFAGLGEATIESMLPANYGKVKVSRDPISGRVRWEAEQIASSSSDADPLGAGDTDGNQQSAEDAGTGDADSSATFEDTDPVEDTDADHVSAITSQVASLNLDVMD